MSKILSLRLARFGWMAWFLGSALAWAAEPSAAAGPEGEAAISERLARVRDLALAQATIDAVAFEPPGHRFIAPVGSTAKSTTVPVPFYRVQGTLRTSPASHIKFEVWLPASGWNGRFNQVGNAGLAGTIIYDEMLDPLVRGYAVAATDDGTVPTNVAWMRDPERVVDYGYRAVHETCRCAKAVTAIFYGRPPEYSYFVGGSKGGQEALMEAHRFPGDFDGITAWSPAADFTHVWAHMIWCAKAVEGENGVSVLGPEKLMLLHRAVLARNRSIDGGSPTDDFLTNPLRVRFDPEDLLVAEGSSAAGLNAREVQAAKLVYSDLRNPRTGQFIAPGMFPGSEAPPGRPSASGHGWTRFLGDAKHYAQPLFGNAVFHDPNWDWRTFDFDQDMTRVDQVLAPILNSAGADLRAFKARGGKLLLTQGWDDTAIPARCTIDFFNRVQQSQGSLAETRTLLRLFLIPGDGHGYALGPSIIDNLGLIADWVERRRAPLMVVARKFVDDDPARGVAAARTLACYPELTAAQP